MEKQNITLSLPKALLRKAKTLAAQEEKSLSELMKDSLEYQIQGQKGFFKARNRQSKLLNQGFNLGTKGRITADREDLHVR